MLLKWGSWRNNRLINLENSMCLHTGIRVVVQKEEQHDFWNMLFLTVPKRGLGSGVDDRDDKLHDNQTYDWIG